MIRVRCACGKDSLVDEDLSLEESPCPHCGRVNTVAGERVRTDGRPSKRRSRRAFKRIARLRKQVTLRLSDRLAIGAAAAMLLTLVLPWFSIAGETTMSWDLVAGAGTMDVLWLLGSWLGAAAAIFCVLKLRGRDRAAALLFIGSEMVFLLVLEALLGGVQMTFTLGEPVLGLLVLLLTFAALLAGHGRLRVGNPGRSTQGILSALTGAFVVVSGIVLAGKLSDMPAGLLGPIEVAAVVEYVSLALAISGAIAGLAAAAGAAPPSRSTAPEREARSAARMAHKTGPTRASIVLFYLSFAVLAVFLVLYIPTATRTPGAFFLVLNLLFLGAGPFVLIGIGILDRLAPPRPEVPDTRTAPSVGIEKTAVALPPLSWVAPPPKPSPTAMRLAEADRLRQSGVITAEEHAALRARILSEL